VAKLALGRPFAARRLHASHSADALAQLIRLDRLLAPDGTLLAFVPSLWISVRAVGNLFGWFGWT